MLSTNQNRHQPAIDRGDLHNVRSLISFIHTVTIDPLGAKSRSFSLGIIYEVPFQRDGLAPYCGSSKERWLEFARGLAIVVRHPEVSWTVNRSVTHTMLQVKDTLRSTVQLSFDGRVFKTYHGPKARERFTNEVRMLRHLEAHNCNFVPRLLEADPEKLRIITTNCGSRVEHLDAKRTQEIFAELELYGVRHDDPDMRNITYRQTDGRFCVIDFEFATLLPGSE